MIEEKPSLEEELVGLNTSVRRTRWIAYALAAVGSLAWGSDLILPSSSDSNPSQAVPASDTLILGKSAAVFDQAGNRFEGVLLQHGVSNGVPVTVLRDKDGQLVVVRGASVVVQ